MSVKSKPKRRGYTPAARARGRRRSSRWRRVDSIPIFQGLEGLEELDRCRFASPSPRAPGLRFVYVSRLRRDHEDRAREVARRGPQEVRWPQQLRPQDLPPPRRRGQAPVPQDRLQAPQGRHPREGRRDRVRPQPHGVHRAAALRRRRQAYILAPARLQVGATVVSRARAPRSRSATACRCGNMPTGTVVHNVELQPGRGGQLGALRRRRHPADGEGRRHGHAAPAVRRDAHGPRSECRATVGTIGNAEHQNVKIGKAGRKRHMGVRPQTRGTAMNPVDHPHGGGEGSTTPGRHPVTPVGRADARATAPARRTRRPTATSSAAARAGRASGRRKR